MMTELLAVVGERIWSVGRTLLRSAAAQQGLAGDKISKTANVLLVLYFVLLLVVVIIFVCVLDFHNVITFSAICI
jgi:hypothetical protein